MVILQGRKSVSTIWNENMFSPDKKYLSLAGVSVKSKKKLLLAKKSVSTSRNKVSLKKIIVIVSLNKTILFLLDRTFVFTSRNEEFVKKTIVKFGFPIISIMVITSKKNYWRIHFTYTEKCFPAFVSASGNYYPANISTSVQRCF